MIVLGLSGGTWSQAQDASTVSAAPAQPKEATIEANVVKIILNDEHRGGVDWGAIVEDFHTAPLKKENDPLWSSKTYRLSFGTLSQDDYNVLLDALDMAGKVSESQPPPVKVPWNVRTEIHFDKPYIHMQVLLSRLKSGDLSLTLDPSFNLPATEIWDGRKTPSSITLGSHTKMLLSDNSTVVIGGFMTEEEIKRTRKLPLLGNIRLLGDIPIFGLVFRSQGRLMQKIETVIFLTVRTNSVDTPEDAETP